MEMLPLVSRNRKLRFLIIVTRGFLALGCTVFCRNGRTCEGLVGASVYCIEAERGNQRVGSAGLGGIGHCMTANFVGWVGGRVWRQLRMLLRRRGQTREVGGSLETPIEVVSQRRWFRANLGMLDSSDSRNDGKGERVEPP